MKITEVPTDELIEAIVATQQFAGPDSSSVRVMKQELLRRVEQSGRLAGGSVLTRVSEPVGGRPP